MILITHQHLDPEALTKKVRSPGNGTVVTFLGTTRNETDGRGVLFLEYECYQPMAERSLTELAQEVQVRWGIQDLAIAHRVGRVEVGEISLVVAVAAPHRKEAFAACQHIVDRIKAVVPIWKKEFFEDGAVWVEGEGSPEAALTGFGLSTEAASGAEAC